MVLSGKLLAVLTTVLNLSVSASLSRDVCTVGESVVLTVEISGGEATVRLPELPDFEVLSSSKTSQVRVINGHSSVSTQYHYVLVPLREGVLEIPPVEVKTPQGSLYTQRLKLKVISSRQRKEKAPPVFVTAEVHPERGYINQAFVYIVKLYSRVPLSDASLISEHIDNFVEDELVKRGPVQKRTVEYIEGKRYRVTQLSYVLYPLSTGSFEIRGLRISVAYRVPRKRDRTNPLWDFFEDDLFPSLKRKVLVTEPVKVEVLPLPPLPSNTIFTGLIGSFNASWNVESLSGAQGDTFTLTLTVKGTGNLRNLKFSQPLSFPGFRVFEDKAVIAQVDVSKDGLKGEVVKKFALIPETAGNVKLSLREPLVYFDPVKGKYVPFPSPSFTLNVKPSALSRGKVVVSPVPEEKVEVKTRSRDIFDIYTGKEALESVSLHPPLWLVLTVGVVFPLFALVVMVAGQLKKRSFREDMQAARRASRAFKRFQQAVERERNPEVVLDAFVRYVRDVSGREGITSLEALNFIKEAVPQDEREKLKKIVEALEMAVYGGGEYAPELVRELTYILKQADKRLRKRRAFSKRLLLIGTVFIITLPLICRAGGDEFFKAAELYRSGHYREALASFVSLYKKGLKNGYVLYNAGNSAYRTGEVGKAILFYRAALFYLPGFSDLKWNLNLARLKRVDKIEPSSMYKLTQALYVPFSLSLSTSAYLFLFFHALFWTLVAFSLMGKRFASTAAKAVAVFYLFFAVSAGLGVKRLYMDKDGVVLAEEVSVYSGTDVKSAVLFVLHEGTEVRVIKSFDNWLAVELPDGRKGWVLKDALGVVQAVLLKGEVPGG